MKNQFSRIKRTSWKTRALLSAGTALIAAQFCHAAAAAPEQADINMLRQQLEEQSRKLTQQQLLLETELKKLEQHKQSLEETRRSIEAMQVQLGMPVEINPLKVSQAEQSMYRGRGPEAAERMDNVLEAVNLFSEPSIMTPKGTFVFDPYLQYAYNSSDRLSVIGFSVFNAVLIGEINVSQSNRTNLIASLGGRYGVTDRFEVEARVPYIYRTDDTLARSIASTSQNELFSADGNGVGDIELAARYQLNAPRDDGAFYIAGLRFKARNGKDIYEVDYDPNFNLPTELATGSGFYSLQPSLSGVLPSDPVVFFGGLNYTWNIKRDVNKTVGSTIPTQVGEVDPGDSIGLNFGMGLSLNERSSFSVSYEHTWIGESTFEGLTNDALDVQLGTLQTTFAYRLNKSTNLNLTIGAGLTEDTPDATMTLRIPIKF
jgi:peptidyl-tRNA hydrolase